MKSDPIGMDFPEPTKREIRDNAEEVIVIVEYWQANGEWKYQFYRPEGKDYPPGFKELLEGIFPNTTVEFIDIADSYCMSYEAHFPNMHLPEHYLDLIGGCF